MAAKKDRLRPRTLAEEERHRQFDKERKKRKGELDYEWYSTRSIFGNTWAYFYILIGGREAGKSYDVMRCFLKQWKTKGIPFTWLRLTEPSMKKMLQNNAAKLVDADLRRKFDLELTVKGNDVFDHGKRMATVLALSTFYSDKGVALYDKDYILGYNICLDEMNREKNERNTFDIVYAFVNQMENLVRSKKQRLRIVLIGNYLEEASDILTCFNFIPEEFGRYKIRKKKAVMDYIKPSRQYLERRKDTVASILAPNESTFTNRIEVDRSCVYKGRLRKPMCVIKFYKSKDSWFTLWDGHVVKRYNGEKVRTIAMRKFLDEVFVTEARDTILALYDSKSLLYRDLITQKTFKKNLEMLKSGGR